MDGKADADDAGGRQDQQAVQAHPFAPETHGVSSGRPRTLSGLAEAPKLRLVVRDDARGKHLGVDSTLAHGIQHRVKTCRKGEASLWAPCEVLAGWRSSRPGMQRISVRPRWWAAAIRPSAARPQGSTSCQLGCDAWKRTAGTCPKRARRCAVIWATTAWFSA